MDNLRILLMILGIIIIVGIYLWGTGFDHRKATNRLTGKHRKKIREPVLDTPVIKPHAEEIDYTDVFRRQGGLPRDEEAEFSAGHGGQTAAEKQPSVIVLYVTAPAGYSFNGGVIKDSLYAAGMTYGDMQIFHHYGVGKSVSRQSIFSVASMLEPGTFDLNAIDSIQTEGIVFFMELPPPIDPAIAFEHMLSTSQRIAEMLKGHLRDEKHQSLSKHKIEELRKFVAGFHV